MTLNPDILINGCHMTQEEVEALEHYASLVPPPHSIIEIGSYRGCSTLALATGAQDGVMIYSIDPHAFWNDPDFAPAKFGPIDKRHYYQRMIEANDRSGGTFPFDRISVIELLSSQVDPSILNQPFGLVFIDGAHRYGSCRADHDRYCPSCLALGGWVAFHDAGEPGVSRVIGEITSGGRYVKELRVRKLAVLRRIA